MTAGRTGDDSRPDQRGDPPLLFVKESRIAAPPEEVFAFHESPGALQRLTPPWENVRFLEGGGSLQPGTRVAISVPVGPFHVRWVAEHTEYQSGRMFADRQVEGPFASWYHRHYCLDDGQGGTILRDEIEYRPPLGALGRLLGARLLRSKLQRMFDYRHDITRRIVEAGDFKPQARPNHA